MFRTVENSDNIKPLEIDSTSSNEYVYIRRNFEEVPNYDQEGEIVGSHWRYEENKIKKSDWEIYESITSTEQKVNKQENNTAPIENEDRASRSYTIGSYITRNGELYKVISEIAYGATFTDNNIKKTTIMDEIQEV